MPMAMAGANERSPGMQKNITNSVTTPMPPGDIFSPPLDCSLHHSGARYLNNKMSTTVEVEIQSETPIR